MVSLLKDAITLTVNIPSLHFHNFNITVQKRICPFYSKIDFLLTFLEDEKFTRNCQAIKCAKQKKFLGKSKHHSPEKFDIATCLVMLGFKFQ